MTLLGCKRQFYPETQKAYCAYCGRERVEMGHIMSRFYMCPVHGEFTPSPVIMYDPDLLTWFVHFEYGSEVNSWDACQAIDKLQDGGNDDGAN